jgi:uncharacterized peroxidase-related enzyme
MSRIPTPATIEAAPAAAQPLLQAVKKQLGVAPNLFRLVANSPAALEGDVPAATRERIALAVAEINGCDYCLSAHTYLGRNVAKLDDAEITANRHGASNDMKADAAVKFAVRVTTARGHITSEDFAAVKAAGYTDAQIIEIVQHVALNTWTNYINTVGETEIDFPIVKGSKVA